MTRVDIFNRLKRDPKLFAGLAVLFVFGVVVIFADLIAPYDHAEMSRREPSAPPTPIHFRDASGNIELRPSVYAARLEDPLKMQYTEDVSRRGQIGFLARGYSYRLLGLIRTDIHLFGIIGAESETAPRINLLGTDDLGRDRFSRLLKAIQFSLLVSPLGTLLACVIGILIGIVSGYALRSIDVLLMGISDAMLSLPTLILILAARAAFPLELPPMRAALLLVLIFALTGWAEIARLARGLVRSIREREFVLAAKASGLSEGRILFRHILPNVAHPLITQATLMLPAFLLAEVALSFLGVGVQEPEPSLGNLLRAASDIAQLNRNPMVILSPAFVIFIFVLAIRLSAAGLRSRNQD